MQNIRKIVTPLLLSLFITALCIGCNLGKRSQSSSDLTQGNDSKQEELSPFSADSTYNFVAHQVSFGPRVANSAPHKACGDWLVEKLTSYGAEVFEQKAVVDNKKGAQIPIRNIIASFNKENSNRILLIAHWDTRPIADNDPFPSLQKEPILGADDGASGVAVLLEIARLMKATNSNAPIDILFADAEDMGESNNEDSWCLGSTYWSKNPHLKDYKADFGILLDMVGAKGACFMWEYFSKTYAPGILSEVWKTAIELGHGKYFVNADGAALTDDHVPIIKNLGIPTIDIVNFDTKRENGFGEHWHTHSDNLEVIDKEVLLAVGSTVWKVISD